MGTFGALLLVNSGYVFWDGGASWGPRHLVPALPFLAILSLPAAARWPRLAWALAGASMAMTLAGVATGSLPDSEVHAPLTDLVWPRVLAGCVTNNWGQVAGLLGWRGLVPLAALEALVVAWAVGWRRSAGALVVAGWCLAAIARLNRNYLEYSEGYYLYLGSRLAAGARLYADTASTQPPLLPQLVGALWRIQPDIWLPRLLAIGCYAVAALLAGRVAARLTPVPWSGPLAIGLAALLPLGAGAPQVLDANAVLAPLAAAVALLWAHVSAAERRGDGAWLPAAAAGMLAAFGLATKLTFAPFAVAPLLAVLGGLLVRRFTRGRERRGLKAPGYTSKAGSSRLQFVPPRPATFRGLRASSRAPHEICVSNPVVSRCPRERASNTELGPQNSLGPGVPPPAQNRPLNRALAVYLLALATGLGAQVVYWQVASGPNSADAVFGELESPLHPAGALLAIFQLIYLEGIPLALAVAGWWSLYRRQCEQGLLSFGFAAATLPLFAVHQGTFVGVARPAEPFIAAFAVAGLYAAGRRLYAAAQPAWWRRAALGLAGALAILTPGAWSAETLLETRTVAPEVVLAPLQAAAVPGQPLLAPPYYAALAGRTMLFDYPDWTVWGMRAAAGAPRERQLAAAAAGLLRDRQIPVVAADFRLAYIGPIAGALPRHYSAAGNDGDDPARAVTFWVPK